MRSKGARDVKKDVKITRRIYKGHNSRRGVREPAAAAITNEGDVKRTSICKIRGSDPFGVGNVTLKIRAPLTPPRGDETQPAHSPDGVAALQQPRDEST